MASNHDGADQNFLPMRRYDERSANGQLAQERQRERELQAIRRRIRKLIEKLEAADDNNMPAKRLYFEILDRERDRIEGKPGTAEPPKAPSEGYGELQQATRSIPSTRPNPRVSSDSNGGLDPGIKSPL